MVKEPSATTATLRVPVGLRDEIASIAQDRDSSMVDVVRDAVQLLRRDEWWRNLHSELDALGQADLGELADEAERFDRVAGDGLRAE